MPLWTNRYNGPGNGYDEAVAVAVDRSGNVIVTGSSAGSRSDSDFATIKYVCVPVPVMTGLQLTNGTFQMRVDDVLQPGTLVIEASTDLAGWAPVFTNTTPTNVLFYTDPDAGNLPGAFTGRSNSRKPVVREHMETGKMKTGTNRCHFFTQIRPRARRLHLSRLEPQPQLPGCKCGADRPGQRRVYLLAA